MRHRGIATIAGGLIALYLVVYYAQGSAQVAGTGGDALSGLVRSFQGR